MAVSTALGVDLLLALGCAAAWACALAAAQLRARPASPAPSRLPAWSVTLLAAAGALLGAWRILVLAPLPASFSADRLLGASALTLPGCLVGLAALILPGLSPGALTRWRVPGFAAAAAFTTAGALAVLTLGSPAGWLPLAVLAAAAVLGAVAATRTLWHGAKDRASLAAATLGVAVVAGSLAVAWMDSRAAAPSSFAGAHHQAAVGGAPPSGTAPSSATQAATRSVAELRGSPSGPLRDYALTARSERVTLDDGRTVDALTFGSLPGPELRAVAGEHVRVTLKNESVPDGVTLHWHGYDVPNAMDGVPGVTQDAVMPGQSFTYEFQAVQTGTYWYHTHQNASANLPRGLYGALVVTAPDEVPAATDLTVPVHAIEGAVLFGSHAGVWREAAAPGTQVRLRLINTDQTTHRFSISGAPYRLAAVDGHDVAGGAEVTGQVLALAAGGRYDVVLTMPHGEVLLASDGARSSGLVLSPGASATHAPRFVEGPELDLAAYGEPAAPAPPADRTASYTADRLLRFVEGVPRFAFTVGGAVYPNIPPLVVRDGERVAITVANRSNETHPMHPHGHHVRVLSIDGRNVTADLRMDSFDVRPGQVWTVLLTADNPGIWMDHCHNLDHAREGMVFHLGYEGVQTPFRHGGSSANRPE